MDPPKKDIKCALAIVLDPDTLKKAKLIQEIRKSNDKNYSLWMPHINLLHPFIPENEFTNHLGALQTALAEIQPFTVSLSHFNFFYRKKGGVIHLAPAQEDIASLRKLQSVCESLFPWCNEASSYSSEGYIPHLTVGGFTKEETTKKVAEFNKQWTRPLKILIDEVQICSQAGKAHKALVKHTLKLGVAARPSVALPNPREPSVQNTTTAATSNSLFHALPSFKFSDTSSTWEECTSSPTDTKIEALSIISYNILFDIYDKDKIFTEQRIPRILEILKQSNSDIVGLCEVTQSILIQLLRDPWIQQTYYISESGLGATVKPYGQVLLSKYPLTLLGHAYSSQKRVIVGTFKFNGRTVHVSVVHLPSEQHGVSSLLQKRICQMGVIYDKFCPVDNQAKDVDCVILGDFNFGDGEEGEDFIIRNDFEDAWLTLKPQDPGYTFDPDTNPLAALNTKSGRRRRLDRIIFNSAGYWIPQRIELLGASPFEIQTPKQTTLYPSDHFGLSCSFTYSASPVVIPKQNKIELPDTSEFEKTIADVKLLKLIEKFTPFETDKGNQTREGAIVALKSALTTVFKSASEFRFYTLGSYALGLHEPNSDIDCLCVGTMERDEFFKEAFQTLTTSPGIQVKRVLKGAVVPILKLLVHGIEFDLQYCFYPTGFRAGKEIMGPSDINEKKMDEKSIQSVHGYLDTLTLINILPSSINFKQVAATVKQWARARGIYSNRFGYLGGYGWNVLVARICQLYPKASPPVLLYKLFVEYSVWKWDAFPLSIICNPDPTASYKMKPQDNLVVLTMTKPYFNSSRNVSKSTRKVLVDEFTLAAKHIQNNHFSLLFEPFDFFSSFNNYIVISAEAITSAEFLSWAGWIESRLIGFCMRAEQKGAHVRPWPLQCATQESNYPFSCCYYIGVLVPEGVNANLGSEVIDWKHEINNWQSTTPGMFLQVKLKKKEKLGTITPFTLPEKEEYSYPQETPEDVLEDPITASGSSPIPSSSTSAQKKGKPVIEEKSKLTTSEAIYNRVKWDDRYNPDEFVIGYLDRFIGMKEILVSLFRDPNVLDQDYIPFHRVWYFKHIPSGTIMWDRKARIDLFQ